MRVALVGAGRFGRRYLQTLAGLRQFELLAVASRNPDIQRLLPAGCTRVEDWTEALALPGLQGALVVTPPASHAAITRTAMRLGLAVLVEKPLTLDLAEAEALLAEPRSAPVMVEHTHLFAPAYRALRARLTGAAPRQVTVEAGGPGPWRADVGVLWDWGAHWVAVCLDLFGHAPVRCACHLLDERRVQEGVGQSLRVELDFGADRFASLQLSNLVEEPRRRLSVVTDDGRVLVYDELQAAALTECVGDEPPVAVPVDATRPLQAALDAFAAAFEDSLAGLGSTPPSDLGLGVDVVRVLAACDRARTSASR